VADPPVQGALSRKCREIEVGVTDMPDHDLIGKTGYDYGVRSTRMYGSSSYPNGNRGN